MSMTELERQAGEHAREIRELYDTMMRVVENGEGEGRAFWVLYNNGMIVLNPEMHELSNESIVGDYVRTECTCGAYQLTPLKGRTTDDEALWDDVFDRYEFHARRQNDRIPKWVLSDGGVRFLAQTIANADKLKAIGVVLGGS